jgi:dTDP-4-dehydrorhamnose 3,5-epimerase
MSTTKLINGGLAVDDRGSVRFVNDFDFQNVKRFYQVENHRQGFIRAWHGHKKEGKYVYVVSGSALIGVVNMDTKEVQKFVLSDKLPKVLDLFRHFHLRALPVLDPSKGLPVAVLTR